MHVSPRAETFGALLEESGSAPGHLTFGGGLPFLSVRASTNRFAGAAHARLLPSPAAVGHSSVCAGSGTVCFNRTLARAAILVRAQLLNDRR